ncbi:MAG: hypothetical protein K2X87_28760, partial [Gemmataceae bacterium]|nr:hypothetical protein [Gemmataceae bacterium]
VAAALLVAGPGVAAEALPRFTEEREAAALHFVRKHCPDLLPPLDELKRASRTAYEQQVRETYQITEYLADLRDDPARYNIELKLWKAENRALVLAARAVTTAGDEKTTAETQLRAVAKELADLDVKAAEYRVQVLERELDAAKTALAKSKDDTDRAARDKYDGLLERARKRRAGS